MSVLRGAGPTGAGDGPRTDERSADGTSGGYDTRWLDLRADADTRARSHDLLDHLLAGTGREHPHLLDLGCGAGAMQRWCADRVPGARWTLMDPDEDLLLVAEQRAGGPVSRRQGRVVDLVPAVLDGVDRVDAVVCSALLDVLPAAELEHLVAVLAASGVPMLAALTVTGDVRLRPGHDHDGPAGAAVHRTATADGATGPAALPLLRSTAVAHGLVVLERATPWLLDPARDRDLVQAWTDGYVAAALAAAGPHEDLTAWAGQRREQASEGLLTVEVAHADLLVTPPAPSPPVTDPAS